LDAGCGYGRNARFLESLGATVVCVDNDSAVLDAVLDPSYVLSLPGKTNDGGRGKVIPIRADLIGAAWPFRPATFTAVISVAFRWDDRFLGNCRRILRTGGYLFVESVGGHGGNYLELPKIGEIERSARMTFDVEFYTESRVGPPEELAVSFKLLARKRMVQVRDMRGLRADSRWGHARYKR